MGVREFNDNYGGAYAPQFSRDMPLHCTPNRVFPIGLQLRSFQHENIPSLALMRRLLSHPTFSVKRVKLQNLL